MNQRRHTSLIVNCLTFEKRLSKGLPMSGKKVDALFVHLLSEYESALDELSHAGIEWVHHQTVTEWHQQHG